MTRIKNFGRGALRVCNMPLRKAIALAHWALHPHLPIKRSHLEITCGFGVLIVGVSIAKCSALCGNMVAHILVDAIGYTIHGIGAAPIIKGTCDLMGVKA